MNTENMERIIEPLLSWFAENARRLPWREKPYPYYVWVSEIMLQQTRVEAVKPFFARFIERLPDTAALAACPEEQLLKLWEGLGYYNRVRNMQKAAQIVVRDYGGELPHTYRELLQLPGIGSYTAGAIASIAYGQAVPAVDGNVLRVISRICGNEEDISKQSVRVQFEHELSAVMPQDRPGMFNQALMELGATVCVPNGAPDCAHCPVRDLCFAERTGRQPELPVKARPKTRRIEERTVLIIRDGRHAAVRRRPEQGLLAGLYELPNYPGHLTQSEALDIAEANGFSPIRILPLAPAKHIFSHIEWRMTGYLILVEERDTQGEVQGGHATSTSVFGMEEREKQDEVQGGHATSTSVFGMEERDTQGEVQDGHAISTSVFGMEERDTQGEVRQEHPMLFVETERTEREYPIPAAFAPYLRYLSIRLGQEKYRGTEG